MRTIRPASVLLLAICGVGCAPSPEPADLILRNGKIVTLEDRTPEVRALAARQGLIVALGSDAEVERFRGPDTRVLDLEGRLAVPGFIEGHGHFVGLGAALLNIDLRDEPTWESVVERVARAVEGAEPGQWILGWGWHQEKWERVPQPTVEGYPVRDLLDRASPENPVLLKHAAGSHAGIANEMALRLAGIDRSTPDPEGGKILRDATGRATGVLRELAYGLLLEAYEADQARMTEDQRRRLERRKIELASAECLANGVTSFQDAGASFETVDLLREMAERGSLDVRVWVMLRADNEALARRIDDYRMVDAADSHLTVGAIKISVDGALGSHGAWLLEPYSDLPDTAGLNTVSLEELEQAAVLARDRGLQLAVHAIGDRGNRETLDIFERALDGRRDVRWRIEHAQHLHPDDVPRFAELGVVASMQAIHCTSDAPWVPLRLGDRRAEEGAYVWRDLLDSGAVVTNGTDVPVEDIDPVTNFHSAVTRIPPGKEPFYPEQAMTRIEALRSATIDAAYAAFQEPSRGSLAPGKLADVVVLSEDILTVPEQQIPDAEVLYTIVGGEVLYNRPGA